MEKRPFLPALFVSLLINTFFQKPAVGADFLGVLGGCGGRSPPATFETPRIPPSKVPKSVRRGVSLVLSPDKNFPIGIFPIPVGIFPIPK